jgi:hypothetical protein
MSKKTTKQSRERAIDRVTDTFIQTTETLSDDHKIDDEAILEGLAAFVADKIEREVDIARENGDDDDAKQRCLYLVRLFTLAIACAVRVEGICPACAVKSFGRGIEAGLELPIAIDVDQAVHEQPTTSEMVH